MRSRYDEGASEDLDEPVTLTERQLRSLKRGATFGMLAVLLALCALAMAAWSLPETRSLISGKPAESGTAQASLPSSAAPSTPAPEVTASAPASAAPTQPAAASPPPAEPIKPVAAAAPSPKPVSHAVQTRAAVTRKVRSKTTEAAFTSTPTPEPFSMETSKPVPSKPVETPKPVAQDSSISLPAPPSGK